MLDKERLKKRSEIFNASAPRLKSGRKTRLQINLVKEERIKKRKDTLERKKRDAVTARESKRQNPSIKNTKKQTPDRDSRQSFAATRRSMRGLNLINISTKENNHNEVSDQFSANETVDKETVDKNYTKSSLPYSKMSAKTTSSGIVTPSKSGKNTPRNIEGSQLIKTVVSEMLDQVEKAAKVLDKARALRLSVEEKKSDEHPSSTSTPKYKSSRSSVDSIETGSYTKKKFKLSGVDRSLRTSTDSVKVTVVTEIDVCEYIDDHLRMKQGAVKVAEDNEEASSLNLGNEVRTVSKSMRIAERAIKRRHLLSRGREEMGPSEPNDKSDSKENSNDKSLLQDLQIKDESKEVVNVQEIESQIKNSEDASTKQLKVEDLVKQRNHNLNVDSLPTNPIRNKIEMLSSGSPSTAIIAEEVESSNKKSCRKCRQRVCRWMPACQQAAESSPPPKISNSKAIEENNKNTSIINKKKKKNIRIKNEITLSNKKIEPENVTKEQKQTTVITTTPSNRIINDAFIEDADEEEPIISLKRKVFKKNKISKSDNEHVHPIAKDALSTVDPTNTIEDSITKKKVPKNIVNTVTDKVVEECNQLSEALLKNSVVSLNPTDNNIVDKEETTKPSNSESNDNNNDLETNSTFLLIDNQIGAKALTLESTPTRKRGRKPNLFYSEDDILEITNVSGDDGLLFLSLEESPIASTRKNVLPEVQSKTLPTSVAMHYKERKQDGLKVGEKPNKKNQTVQGLEKRDSLKDVLKASQVNNGDINASSHKKKRGRKPKIFPGIGEH